MISTQGPNGMRQVVTEDLMWSVYVCGVKVPTTCKVLADCPPSIPSVCVISEVVKCVDRAVNAKETLMKSLWVYAPKGEAPKEEAP